MPVFTKAVTWLPMEIVQDLENQLWVQLVYLSSTRQNPSEQNLKAPIYWHIMHFRAVELRSPSHDSRFLAVGFALSHVGEKGVRWQPSLLLHYHCISVYALLRFWLCFKRSFHRTLGKMMFGESSQPTSLRACEIHPYCVLYLLVPPTHFLSSIFYHKVQFSLL